MQIGYALDDVVRKLASEPQAIVSCENDDFETRELDKLFSPFSSGAPDSTFLGVADLPVERPFGFWRLGGRYS